MRILIRATNWVGDALMSLPAIERVRSHFATAHIAILAKPYVADLYRQQKVCDELIHLESPGVHAGVGGRERLAEKIRGMNFDVALLLQNAFDAAWIVWRAGIKKRVGYARDGRSWLLSDAIAVPKKGEIPAHEQFYYLELIRRAGWTKTIEPSSPVRLEISETQMEWAKNMLESAGAREGAYRVAIGVGAAYGSAKCWPPSRFAELASRLQDEKDAEIILFGTAADDAVAQLISGGLKRPAINLTGKTKISGLPALMASCNLFVGNDSGPMHVAAAAGLPVVAIFGPTDPDGTAPISASAIVVREKPYCSPCFLRRCPTDHRCMNEIEVDKVFDATKIFTEKTRAPDA